MSLSAHRHFAQGEAFNLVRPSAPVNRRHETLPDALDDFGLGKRELFERSLESRDDCLRGIAALDHLREFLGNIVLHESVLLLRPPLSDLRETLLSEVLFQSLRVALVGREEEQEIFDSSTLERSGEIIHGLL